MDTELSSPQEEATRALNAETRLRWLNVAALVAGLAALALGPLVGGLFIALSLTGQPGADVVSVITIGLSMVALGLGLGGALAWISYQGLRDRPSRPFRPRMMWIWVCLAATGLTLIVGQVVLSFDLLAPLTFPLFHVLGITIPAILMLVLVAQGLKRVAPAPTRRQVIGQMVWGAFGTTAIAFTLEAITLAVALVVVVVILALRPGGLAQLNELRAMLADPAQLADPQLLADWLLKPAVLIPAAVMLVVFAPLIEEAVKSLGVPLLSLGTGRTPSPAQGWLWGIAAGAGFAITEGLFNSAASLPFWAGIALSRVGATGMHMLTTGLTGLGWARTLDSRRPWPLVGGYLASVTLHGLWNGMTVLVVVSSLWMMARPGDAARTAGSGLAILVGVMGVILLVAAVIGVGVYVTLQVGRENVERDE